MARIISVTGVQPRYRYGQEEITRAVETWLSDFPGLLELYNRISRSSKVESKGYACSLDEILSLGGSSMRSSLFEERGAALGVEAASRALAQAGAGPDDISTFVCTSCTFPAIPPLDSIIAPRLGLLPDIRRISLYQHGCAGGVVSVALASMLCSGDRKTLVLSMELCSLLFHLNDTTAIGVLGGVLFADGAAAAVISMNEEDDGLQIVKTHSELVPESRHAMGYEARDDGMYLFLHPALPGIVSSSAPEAVRAFLREEGLQPGDIKWWLIHPGGAKVLRALEDSLGLQQWQTRWSWDVLSRCGNMSSATILFVLEEFLKSKVCEDGDNVMIVGIGPGLTLELVLLKNHA